MHTNRRLFDWVAAALVLLMLPIGIVIIGSALFHHVVLKDVELRRMIRG